MPDAAPDARRVLYVDDDAGLRRLVQRELTRHGYAVWLAADGEEGVRLAAGSRFDAICLDYYMPGQDGLETLARLRTLPDPAPVVFVTGADEGRIAVAALRAGAADYVIKDPGPDFLALLRAAVDGAVEREQLRRDKQRAEAAVREARDRAEELAEQRATLLREVNHRVANSLQLVASLARMQEAAIADPAGRASVAEMRARVLAIAQVHRRLYTSDDVRTVALDEYLGGLLEELGRSMDGADGVAVELRAQRVTVPTDRAVSLGVIVTELVTNAAKYAYPGVARGPIRVLLESAGEGVALVVEDDGVGHAVDSPPQGTGMGTRVVAALASNLGGRVERRARARGTSVAVLFPLRAA